MSEFPCESCGSKKRFHKKGCPVETVATEFIQSGEPTAEVVSITQASSQIDTQEVIRSPQDLPEVGEWYVVSLRSLVDLDAATDKLIHVLDLVVAPCLSTEPHGRDFRVTFDMDRTKQFVAHFPGQLFAKTGNVAKMLHGLAESLEGVK